MLKELKKSDQQEFVCNYCSKSYRRESTLFAHMCEKKRRFEQEKEIGVQHGYRAYLKFYKFNQPSTTKPKSYTDFANSQFYIAFVKFGRHIKMINALKPDRFVEFVIKENKKIDHWCKDKIYDEYLIKMLKNENPQDTLQRGLERMISWADKERSEYNHYFRYGSPATICRDITNGRISPWVLYNCTSGQEFLASLDEDHLGLIYNYIDPGYWANYFGNYLTDTEHMKKTLKEAGL